MNININNGRDKICKNLAGGIRAVYLAPYKKVTRSNIAYDGIELTVFPQTFIYKFKMIGNTTFVQSQQENDGGKSFSQSITLNFSKISAFDNIQFSKLLRKDYFIVVEDNNNNFLLLGFRNGLECESIKTSSDQNYEIAFKGEEENFAPFCDQLINNNLIVIEGQNYIFQDNENYIFQNDNNYIFQ